MIVDCFQRIFLEGTELDNNCTSVES